MLIHSTGTLYYRLVLPAVDNTTLYTQQILNLKKIFLAVLSTAISFLSSFSPANLDSVCYCQTNFVFLSHHSFLNFQELPTAYGSKFQFLCLIFQSCQSQTLPYQLKLIFHNLPGEPVL